MNNINEYLEGITDKKHRKKIIHLLKWIQDSYPELTLQIKWKQPIFTAHDTYIIGFSVAKNHFTIGPEIRTLDHFIAEVEKDNFKHGKNTIQISFKDEIPEKLLKSLIEYTLEDKKGVQTFWDKRGVRE